MAARTSRWALSTRSPLRAGGFALARYHGPLGTHAWLARTVGAREAGGVSSGKSVPGVPVPRSPLGTGLAGSLAQAVGASLPAAVGNVRAIPQRQGCHRPRSHPSRGTLLLQHSASGAWSGTGAGARLGPLQLNAGVLLQQSAMDPVSCCWSAGRTDMWSWGARLLSAGGWLLWGLMDPGVW